MEQDAVIFTVILGSFRSGNADVRLCVSCANFGSWHSYELETLRNLLSTTVIAKNKVVLDAAEGLANQKLPWRGYPFMHYMYTAELRRSFAKALVRHNDPKKAVPSRLVAFCVAQLAVSPCESSLNNILSWELGYFFPSRGRIPDFQIREVK